MYKNCQTYFQKLARQILNVLGVPDFLNMFGHFSALRRKLLLYPYS